MQKHFDLREGRGDDTGVGSATADPRRDPGHSASFPFFSIITPAWNREACISRCLDSLLGQSFCDFEAIVVDDHSTDATASIVRGYTEKDSRIRLISHQENRGTCAAKNTGVNASLGQWLLFVDSDWEIMPYALERLYSMALMAPADVGLIGGYTKSDFGEIWPSASFPREPFGFSEYLIWFEKCLEAASDWLVCRRKDVFKRVNWPTDRRLENQFHLRVARDWKIWVSDEVLSIEYTDSENRYCSDRTVVKEKRILLAARDQARMFVEILDEFGPDLKKYAPGRYRECLFLSVYYAFLAGCRREGFVNAVRALRQWPRSFHVWGLLVVGMFGPKVVLKVKEIPAVKPFVRRLARFSRQA